ncbi:MAG: aminotransferase class I/II-fold pyridoxal phosphate-dependent enzyme [Eubacterium sp.]
MPNQFFSTLEEYCKQGILPMHMPGHKRNPVCVMPNPYCLDVTEVPGVDDLHHPEEIIRDLMEDLVDWYDSKRTFLLVNGSTSGILSAITACCHAGDEILVARNCHKSVYNAIKLLGLKPVYIYPQHLEGAMGELGIAGQIEVSEIRRRLHEHPDVKCAMITSPTYEGIISDIAAIAQVLHEKDIPLIVDEAHGAHFNWIPSFPETAVRQGADLVIESLHKTLPALTQTAVLHQKGDRIDEERLLWALQTYQSSSPSYILMASIARCYDYIQNEETFSAECFVKNLDEFYEQISHLQKLEVLRRENMDPSKIVISTARTNLTGQQLEEILLDRYHIQLEMSCGNYALGMATICDTKENLVRFASALCDLDRSLTYAQIGAKRTFTYKVKPPQCRLFSYEVEHLPQEDILLSEAKGHIAAKDIYLYPPGIPFAVAGEVFSGEMIEVLLDGLNSGYEVHGVEDGKVCICAGRQ